MARLNPDPYDQTIFALVNHVTGVLDSPDQVRSALVTLERAGFAGNDIDLFTGEEGARQLDLSGSVHSGMLRLARRLETSIGDEGPVHGRIERELRGGRTLVSVNLSGGKHSKTLVMKLLTSCLAREVHHWGRWSFEDAH